MVIGFNSLRNELSKYGINPSGNLQTDIAALNKVRESKGESPIDAASFINTMHKMHETQNKNHTKNNNQNSSGNPPPWITLMQSLGLQPQGSKEADFAAISDKLPQLESLPLSSEQKANLDLLKTQFEQYQNQSV